MSNTVLMGLGGIGCSVAKTIYQGQDSWYDDVFFLDNPDSDVILDEAEMIHIEKEENGDKPAHEKYEKEYEHIGDRFSELKDEEIIFVVSGKSKLSGAALSILYHLRDNDITILYVAPDTNFLTGIVKKQEKFARNVLQEYARSGMFEQIYLFSNKSIEDASGGFTVKNYYEQVNNYIAYSFNMLMYGKRTKPEYDNLSEPHEVTRIKSLGIVLDNGERMYYDISQQRDDDVMFPAEKRYYYFMNTEKLQNDVNLLKNIKKKILDKKSKFMEASYSIYDFGEEDTFVLVEFCTSLVQH